MIVRIFITWNKHIITNVCLREAQYNTNALFFFLLLGHSNIIPVLLGPKLNHIGVELGIF